MKRDLELIRKMVLAVEDHPAGYAPEMKFEGYTEEQVGYHAFLLVDAEMAVGNDYTSVGSESPEWHILHLTWKGHEFAEAARDDTRWKKAMGIVQEKGGSVTVAVLTQLLGSLMRAALGLP